MSQHGCPERLSNRSKGFQEDGSSQPTMEVLVETLTGTAFEMTVSPSDTILAIKSKICRVEGIPVSQQHLVYKLRELEDSSSLRALGIVHGARLRLVLGLRGGPVATRRLPRAEPWRDLPRLLGPNREDDEEWGSASGSGASGSGAGGAGGCKVTVLVFRDGERVNMLRVRENRDGTYSPLDQQKYSSSLTHLAEDDVCDDDIASGAEVGGEAAAVALHQNAVTQNKMVALRRRMQSLSVRRRAPPGERPEIQKTRSEESLAVHGLIDETNAALFIDRIYPTYSEIDENFIPRYERSYSKYEYHKAFADAYELPPPRRRAEAKQAVLEAVSENNINRLSVSETYGAGGGGLVVAGAGAGAEAARGDERAPASRRTRHTLGMLSPQEYARIACGEAAWRARGFGSSSQLAPAPAPLAPPSPAHAHSASSLHAPPARPPPPRAPPLAVLSSSTSDLEKLRRNRILPALSRHRNREHLHLSDEGLNLSHRPHLEVGSERRQRRIEKIAEMENSRLYTFGDFEYVEKETVEPQKEEIEKKEVKEKKLRIRCGFCKKKLSIATVHKCRCGAEFCAPHRYAEVHGCAYDYKANAHQYLQRANPLVSAPKLPKI